MDKGKSDEMLQAILTGGSTDIEAWHLINDFIMVLTLVLFQEWLRKQDDPESTALEVLATWRERVIASYNTEKSQLAEFSKTPIGRLMAHRVPEASKMDESFMGILTKVTRDLEKSILTGLNLQSKR